MPLPSSSFALTFDEVKRQAASLQKTLSWLLGEDESKRQYTRAQWRSAHRDNLLALRRQVTKLEKMSELSWQLNQDKIEIFFLKIDKKVEVLAKDANFYDKIYDDCYQQFIFLLTSFEDARRHSSHQCQRVLKYKLVDLFLLFSSVKFRRHIDDASPMLLLDALAQFDALEEQVKVKPPASLELSASTVCELWQCVRYQVRDLKVLCDAFGQEFPDSLFAEKSEVSVNEAFRIIKDLVSQDSLKSKLEAKKQALIDDIKKLSQIFSNPPLKTVFSVRFNGRSYRIYIDSVIDLTDRARPKLQQLERLLGRVDRKGGIEDLVSGAKAFEETLKQLSGDKPFSLQNRLADERLERERKSVRASLISLDYQLRECREQRLLLDALSVLSAPLQKRATECIQHVKSLLENDVYLKRELASRSMRPLEAAILQLTRELVELSTGIDNGCEDYIERWFSNSEAAQDVHMQKLRCVLTDSILRQQALEHLFNNLNYFSIIAVWVDLLSSQSFSSEKLSDCQEWVGRVREKFMSLQFKCLSPYKRSEFLSDILQIIRTECSERMQQDISKSHNGGLLATFRYRVILSLYLFCRAIGLFRRHSYALFANSQEQEVRDLLHNTSQELLNLQDNSSLRQGLFRTKHDNVFRSEPCDRSAQPIVIS